MDILHALLFPYISSKMPFRHTVKFLSGGRNISVLRNDIRNRLLNQNLKELYLIQSAQMFDVTYKQQVKL